MRFLMHDGVGIGPRSLGASPTSPTQSISANQEPQAPSGITSRLVPLMNRVTTVKEAMIFTDLNVGSATPDQPTGWQQDAFQSVSFFVPDNWQAGRIWARRDCNFDVNPGPNSCLDGGCNGGLECDPHTGTNLTVGLTGTHYQGVPPATLAEFTLGAQDSYDVSLVDGYNLPVRISNNQGCHVADCPVDLGPNCPAPLKGPFDSTGFPVGCKSACEAGLGDPEGNCPNAYAYAYDDPTSLFHCSNADYTITFCP
ncbi:hypothetical protein ACG7TL_008711 [Trametes sanguinea]